MHAYHAAPCSPPYNVPYRRTHHNRTKQREKEEQRLMGKWTWEEILYGAGPWTQPGEYRRPKEEIEAAKVERRYYEEKYRRIEEWPQ
jgi:hypothetical protein